MEANDRILYMFSAVFAFATLLLLVVPFLRRKSDLFTSWNTFLVGTFIFTGLSGINATRGAHYLPDYSANDYFLYYIGAIACYGSAALSYYFLKRPRRMAGRYLLSWPKLEGWTLVMLTIAMAAAGVITQLPQLPGFGKLIFQFALSLPLLALACAFIAWFRSPANPLLISLLLVVGVFVVVVTLGLGSSRRYFVAAAAVPPVCLYWIWLRYKPTTTIIAWLLAGALIGMPMFQALSIARGTAKKTASSPMQRAVTILKLLPKGMLNASSLDEFMGQDSVESALLTIHMLYDGSDRLQVAPFHSAFYVITNPIPRTMWEGKPVGLGSVVPDVARFDKRGVNANLGINMAGQCYYDGGLFFHVLYGVILGAFFRFYDELLVRQPGNPLLLGGLVFMAPQILGLPRGGLETMALQVSLGFVTVVVASWLSRLVFGSGIVYPRTDHLVDYPVLRSPNDWAKWMQSYTAVSVAPRPRLDDDLEEEGAILGTPAR